MRINKGALQRAAKERALTAEEARRLLHYDPATGVLRWRRREGDTRGINRFNAVLAGTEAGAPDVHGYRVVQIGPVKHRAHRLAWLIARGAWPSGDMDHADGCPANNCLANLRDGGFSRNMRNRRGWSGAGAKNVYSNGNGTYFVRVEVDGRAVRGGTFATLEEAAAKAREMREALHGEYANHAHRADAPLNSRWTSPSAGTPNAPSATGLSPSATSRRDATSNPL